MSPPARRLVVRASGHPLVRATHAKTLELSTEPDISARATCVVAVAPAGALDALTGLRGPLTVTLRAAGRSERVAAVANPAFAGGSRAVVRRSGRRSPETLAVGADKAAADLDRGLVRALAEPGCEVEVVVEAGGGPPEATAALLVVPPALAAAATDEVVRAMASTGVVVDAHGSGPGAAALAGRAGVPLDPPTRLGEVLGRLERGEAVALVCDPDRPGEAARLVRDAAGAGVPVRAVAGVGPATAALVAAGLPGVPRALLGDPPAAAAARGRQLRTLAALGVAGVWEGRLSRLLPLVADLAAWRPRAPAGVLLDPGGFAETLLPGPAAALADAAARAPARAGAVAVADLRAAAAAGAGGPDEGGPGGGGLDGGVRDVLAALLDEGVTPHTLARALRRLPGVGGREAYDLVLAVKHEREATGG